MATDPLQAALAHHRAGRLEEAERIYRKVVGNQPYNAEAIQHLGVLEHQRGRYGEAAGLFERAIALKPGIHNWRYNLGQALCAMGRVKEAIPHFHEALRLKPDAAEVLESLGGALAVDRRLEEAVGAYQRALAINPMMGGVRQNLATALLELRRFDEAILAHQAALQFQPRSVSLRNNLAAALDHAERLVEAAAAYREALQLDADNATLHYNLGVALGKLDEFAESEKHLRRAMELDPKRFQAAHNLGRTLLDTWRLEEGIEAFRAAVEAGPDWDLSHTSLLLALHYLPAGHALAAPEALLAEHKAWNQRHAQKHMPAGGRAINDPGRDRPLRIGLLSGDLRSHPVAHFLLPALEHRDRGAAKVVCYADHSRDDIISQKLAGQADEWKRVHGMMDDAVAEMVAADGIDILVDLSGHTAANRLLVFARRPAPVQASFLGYPDTTGLTAMDWRITDAVADPQGEAERWHTERLMRLPVCAWCYAPIFAEADAQITAREAGRPVTFGSFNNIRKVTREGVGLWSRILKRVPGSRFVLKTRAFREQSTRERMLGAFAEEGIEAGRIELLDKAAKMVDHLRLYNTIDAALDTFPYNGTTTTCEALWMGRPVVTLAGKTHHARVGASLLSTAGLGEWIARSTDEYVDKAVGVGEQAAAGKGAVGEALRRQLMTSALMDGKRYAKDLDGAYRKMWVDAVERAGM